MVAVNTPTYPLNVMEAEVKPPSDVAYASVEGVVMEEAAKFVRLYKLDFDETLSDARLAFMAAYHSYRPARDVPDKGKYHFGGWVQSKVRWALVSSLQARIKRYGQAWDSSETLDSHPEVNAFDRDRLMEKVSDDARTVIAASSGPLQMVPPTGRKSALVRFLVEMGWCAGRIAESLKEIKEAICE